MARIKGPVHLDIVGKDSNGDTFSRRTRVSSYESAMFQASEARIIIRRCGGELVSFEVASVTLGVEL